MSEASQTETISDKIIGIAVATMFVLVIVGSFAVNLFGIGMPRLVIVAAALETSQPGDATSNGWIVRGKVLYEGEPVQDAKVWAIASDAQGNRYAPKTSQTDQFGGYELEPFPKVIGGSKGKGVTDVSVYATAVVKVAQDGDTVDKTIKGEELLGLGGVGRTRWIKLPPSALVAIPTIFFVSLMLGLFRFSPGSRWIKVQYFGSVALGIAFTITMVIYISVGLYMVSVSASPGDALSLGFATIFHGTYLENVGPEWLFSLTAPGAPDTVVKGLGAPLWVLLLSVLGSGVFTVSLVVSHISKELKLTDPANVRQQVQDIVKHQFYVLFAPLGAVIVYQLMVIAGAASQAVTVGIAAIAAGVALNTILNKAIKTVTELIGQ